MNNKHGQITQRACDKSWYLCTTFFFPLYLASTKGWCEVGKGKSGWGLLSAAHLALVHPISSDLDACCFKDGGGHPSVVDSGTLVSHRHRLTRSCHYWVTSVRKAITGVVFGTVFRNARGPNKAWMLNTCLPVGSLLCGHCILNANGGLGERWLNRVMKATLMRHNTSNYGNDGIKTKRFISLMLPPP